MSDNSPKPEWNNFSERSPDRDLGLQVENSIFWVSRRGLADRSPVFNAMLFGEFKESRQEIIKLAEKEADEILELLRCIFPCEDQSEEKKPVDGENVGLLLSLGDEYLITDLVDRCWQFIDARLDCATVQKSGEFLQLAIQYKKKDVVRAGLRRFTRFKMCPGLVSHQAFRDLPVSICYAVLMICSWRDSVPTRHDLKHIGQKRGICISHDGDMRAAVSKCVACKRMVCECDCCQNREENNCHVCHQCDTEYGETDFVCKCVDPIIEAELEKLGWM